MELNKAFDQWIIKMRKTKKKKSTEIGNRKLLALDLNSWSPR